MADLDHIVITADSKRLGGQLSEIPLKLRRISGERALLMLTDGTELGPVSVIAEGDDAYEVAVREGFTGTRTEWLASLKGAKGDASTVPGPANNLTIGTVTRGDQAEAQITGTAPSQTLSLVLPKGDKGDPGPASNVSWNALLDKPVTFTPATHTHLIGDTTGLQAALDGKVGTSDTRLTDARTPTAHTHAWAEITGKPSTFAPAAHTHAIGDVTGLQAKLDQIPVDTDWTATGFTFATGWSVYTSNAGVWKPFAWRTKGGRVQLNGLVSRTGANAAAGSVVGTLPATARPSRSWITGNVRIDADGTVSCNEAVAQGAYAALTGDASIG